MKLSHAVGQALRNVRLEKGYTLRKVNNKCFVSIGQICDIERGHKGTSPETLEVIATQGLGITVEQLLDEINQALQGKVVTK